MATRGQLAAGVGGVGLGALAAEGIQHAADRELVTDRQARTIPGAIAGTAFAAAAIGGTGIVQMPPATVFTLAGIGLGSATWGIARDRGLAPRLTIDVPEEVNLAGPLVSAAVFGGVGLAAAAAGGLVR